MPCLILDIILKKVKNLNKIIYAIMLLGLMGAVPGICGEKEDLFASISALDIQCQDYALCAPLSKKQQAYALKHLEKTNSEKIYRFRDNNLNIVADKETHRVLVMFQQFKKVGQQAVQDLLGHLFITYGDPTVSAHDKLVYWAWGEKEKFTADQYKAARENQRQLKIIATVKLNSEVNIMEKGKGQARGDLYYIISSDPLLRFFKDS